MTNDKLLNDGAKLKPCPFCGCKLVVIRSRAVHCDNCGACPISQDKDDIEHNFIAWNTRAAPDVNDTNVADMQKQIDELVEALEWCRAKGSDEIQHIVDHALAKHQKKGN